MTSDGKASNDKSDALPPRPFAGNEIVDSVSETTGAFFVKGWGSYVFPVLGSALLMTLCFFMGRSGYSIFWLVFFVGLSFLKTKLWRARQKHHLALQAASKREKETVLRYFEGASKIQDLPAWVNFPDTERVEWFNKIILQLWPYIGEYTKQFIHENIEPQIKDNLPDAFKSFRFEKMDMGDIPVRLTGIKVYVENVGYDRIILDLDLTYAGDCEFVIAVGSIKAGMTNLQFRGKARCIMKPLLPRPPLVGAVTVFFLDEPSLDFNLTGIGEMVEIPGLFGAIRRVVVAQIGNVCVLPNSLTIPLVEHIDMAKLKLINPDGILRIHLLEARNLPKSDVGMFKKGKSDPYAQLAVGGQTFKSKVIEENLNPRWDEWYEAIVDQANAQHLQLELFDEDDTSKDDFLGRLKVDIGTVRKAGIWDDWVPLDAAKSGEVHLMMQWIRLSEDRNDLAELGSEWETVNGELHSAILMLFIDNATDVPSHKQDLEPSPYINLVLNQSQFRTHVRQNTNNPIFQQKATFLVKDPEYATLHIQAVQESSDKILAQGSVSLKEVMNQPGMQLQQHPCQLSRGTETCIVNIWLKLLVFKPSPKRDQY